MAINPFLKPQVLIKGLALEEYDGYDISSDIIGWNHSTRAQGGYWTAGFRMEGPAKDLQQVYNYWLGFKIREVVAGFTTWEGLIYEMDFTYHGVTRRRSLDLMYNYIQVLYQDSEGETQETAVGTVADSIAHYGRHELIYTADQLSSTAADALRDTLLKSWGWPYSRTVGANVKIEYSDIEQNSGEVDIATLDVTCCGLAFTANWRHEQVGDGSADNLTDWFSEIVDTDCEFLSPHVITANTLQVYKDTSQPRRCWDVIQDLVSIGDTSGNPYRAYVGNNGIMVYEVIDTTPMYYVAKGKLYNAEGEPANPWIITPAVVRDMDSNIQGIMAGGWLRDWRDFYPDEIGVDANGNITMRSSLFDEGDILVSQLEALAGLFEPED